MTRTRRPRVRRAIHGGLLTGAVVVAGAAAFLGASSPVPADGPRVPVTPTAPAPDPIDVATPLPGTTAPAPGTTAPAPGTTAPAPGTTAPAPGTTRPLPTEDPDPVIGAEPATLALPELGVQAPVIAVGLDAGGGVEVPADIGVVGWFDESARIGSSRGSSVLVGHRDAADIGIGALGAIETLDPGAVVEVTVDDGRTVRYIVEEVGYVEKANFAAIVRDVFDREGPPRLTLITCGGAFDDATGSYLSNVIVTAQPADLLLSTAGGGLAPP